MSLQTQSKGKLRKVALLLNGPADADVELFYVRVPGIAAGTASTTLIPDAQVASDQKLHVTGWSIESAGSAWTSGTNIKIQDTAGTPVVVTTVLTANLPTSSAGVALGKGTQTLGEGYVTGCTAGKGLVLAQTGTYSGSDALTVRVWGYKTTTTALTYS